MSTEKLRRKFDEAYEDAKQFVDVDPTTRSYLDAHYKQATVGDCTIAGCIIAVGCAERHAWNELQGMNTETAMTSYVRRVVTLRNGVGSWRGATTFGIFRHENQKVNTKNPKCKRMELNLESFGM